MEKIGKTLMASFAKRSVLGKQVQASLVVEFGNELLRQYWGNIGKKQAKFLHLKKNILTVSAANSLIAQELKFKQYKIVERVNEKFGKDTVKKIVILQKSVDKKEDLI